MVLGYVSEAKVRPYEKGDGAERSVRLSDWINHLQLQQQAGPVLVA